MIPEWFFGLAGMLTDWLFSLFPTSPSAAITFTAQDLVTPWVTGLSQLGAWVPWEVVVICVPIATAAYGLAFTMRIARAIIGHLPFFGGNG